MRRQLILVMTVGIITSCTWDRDEAVGPGTFPEKYDVEEGSAGLELEREELEQRGRLRKPAPDPIPIDRDLLRSELQRISFPTDRDGILEGLSDSKLNAVQQRWLDAWLAKGVYRSIDEVLIALDHAEHSRPASPR